MNVETGGLATVEEIRKMEQRERAKYVPVNRDLTKKEAFEKQIRLYAPCGCGSGKKFKFCCKR